MIESWRQLLASADIQETSFWKEHPPTCYRHGQHPGSAGYQNPANKRKIAPESSNPSNSYELQKHQKQPSVTISAPNHSRISSLDPTVAADLEVASGNRVRSDTMFAHSENHMKDGVQDGIESAVEDQMASGTASRSDRKYEGKDAINHAAERKLK